MRRIRRVNSDPNPLFTAWLQEFRREAVQKENLNLVKVYDTCIDSLGRYPLALESGQHCLLLAGFGKTICARLDKKLEEHRKQSDIIQPDFPISPLRTVHDFENAGNRNRENTREGKTEDVGGDEEDLRNREKENCLISGEMIKKEGSNKRSADIAPTHLISNEENRNISSDPPSDIDEDGSCMDEEDVGEFHPNYTKMNKTARTKDEFQQFERLMESSQRKDEQLKRKHENQDLLTSGESPCKKINNYQRDRNSGETSKTVLDYNKEVFGHEDPVVDDRASPELDNDRVDDLHDADDQVEADEALSQEEEDYQLALRLSQQEILDHNESIVSLRSQEEEDMKLARELQDQLDQEARDFRANLGISSPLRSRSRATLVSPAPGSSDGLPSPDNSPAKTRCLAAAVEDCGHVVDLRTSSPTAADIEEPSISGSPDCISVPSSPENRHGDDSVPDFHQRPPSSPDLVAEVSGSSSTRGNRSAANFSFGSPSINLSEPNLDGEERNDVNDSGNNEFINNEDKFPALARFSRIISQSGILGRMEDEESAAGPSKRGGRGGARGRGRGRGQGRAKVSRQNDSQADDNEGSQNTSRQGEGSKGRKGKEYVPKTRSGAYAILITLHKMSQRDDYIGFMRKEELQKAAQPLSDQSFSVRNAHSEFYTAWSSVSTLVKRDLVTRWSNPAKFNITDKGSQLAARILNVENSGNVSQSIESETANGNINTSSTNKNASSQSKSSGGSENNLNFDIDDLSFSESFSQPGPSSSSKETGYAVSHDIRARDLQTSSGSCPSGPGRSGNSIRSLLDVDEAGLHPLLRMQRGYLAAASTASNPDNGHVPEFELSAGQFDVVLCVDNTETTGGGAGGRKTLKTETIRHLESCGVAYNRRNLNVGDFLWIARERTGVIPGQFQQQAPRELVLPYIVERKRLDDLWASVKDGRYEEQKFRMKSSGLHRLYYLIEDHSKQKQYWSNAQGGRPVTTESINQAVSNTAVQEGFSIVKTRDQKGSVEFLALFTRILNNKYSKLNLTSCTQADLSNGLVGDRDTCLLTFSELNSASRKNRKMTMKETFAKMLLKMKGLSVEMAQAVVDEFPTPKIFRDALLQCDSDSARIKLIQDVSVGLNSKRKIPKSLAEALASFWTKNDLTTL